MKTQFETLFAVSVQHAYYIGNCEDVAFVIPADTAALLKNGKLFARQLGGKLHVLVETDGTGAASRPIPGKRLRLGLRVTNPFFSNFTKLDDEDPPRSKLLYRNAATSTALDSPVKVPLIGQIFSHLLARPGRPLTVHLKNGDGTVRQTDTITAAADRTTVSYDLSGQDPGLYSIEETDAAGATTTAYYSDADLLTAGVFGIIELEIHSDLYGAAVPAEFRVTFAAREETLRYYVVARNYSPIEVGKLSVVDAGFGEDQRPQISFTPISSSSFTGPELALLGDPSARVVLFKATLPIARTEKARKKVQLNKNGDVLIAHLPQPGPEKPNADMIISVSKP